MVQSKSQTKRMSIGGREGGDLGDDDDDDDDDVAADPSLPEWASTSTLASMDRCTVMLSVEMFY